jgi:threonine dehydrogenase-like Zn-dependent dehydrogenase
MTGSTFTSRAFWIEGPQTGAIRVQTICSGVSRATEALVFRGDVPESLSWEMRAPHQEGDFPWPVKYGYASVGRVVDGSPDLLGSLVFCLYPHQDRYVVSAEDVIPLPSGVSPERGILAANMETALNAIWDGGLKAGDRVSVIGGGAVGLLVAFLAARTPGTSVELVDIDPTRQIAARALGASFALPEQARREADVVFHASGRGDGLNTALSVAGREARVVELSWYGKGTVSVALGEAFHPRRLRIQSSQVGHLPPQQLPRWTHKRRLETALGLCAAEELDLLVEEASDFLDLPLTMKRLQTEGGFCHRIRYDL